jgi:hypothetical protein
MQDCYFVAAAAAAAFALVPAQAKPVINQPVLPFCSVRAICAVSVMATSFCLNVYTAGTTN